MADALGDLSEKVLNRTLVLNVPRGLNEKYSHLVALITRTHPLPPFFDVRGDLLIKESIMESKAIVPMALVATTSAPWAPGTPAPPSTGVPPGFLAQPPASRPQGSPASAAGSNYNGNRNQQCW